MYKDKRKKQKSKKDPDKVLRNNEKTQSILFLFEKEKAKLKQIKINKI